MVAFACGAAMLGCGCRPDTAALDRNDRETPLFRKAVECERSGNLDEAIRLYGEVLLDHARLASAHLQMALLLHDHRQDYTGAIYHYRTYLELRPDAEKRELIQDRIRIAEQLLAAQLVRRVGGDVAGAAQAKQLADNEKLNKRVVALEGEKQVLADAKTELERQVKVLTADVDRLRRLVDRLQMPSTPASEHQVRPSVLPRLSRTTPAEPTPTPARAQPAPVAAPAAPALSVLRPSAEVAPPASPPPEPVATPAAAAPPTRVEPIIVTPREPAPALPSDGLVAPRPLESSTPPATPAAVAPPATTPPPDEEPLLGDVGAPAGAGARRPSVQTYVVQPGDTLFRIAEKFYGDSGQWKKLRDANRNRIDPDGRVRAGQILLVP